MNFCYYDLLSPQYCPLISETCLLQVVAKEPGQLIRIFSKGTRKYLVPLLSALWHRCLRRGAGNVQRGADSSTLKPGHGSRDLIFKIRVQATLFVVVQQRKLFIGVTISVSENKRTAHRTSVGKLLERLPLK
jgi:hypothetical protein